MHRHKKCCSFFPSDSTIKYLWKGDFTMEILAPKRIYTRNNPNPNPHKVVEDPEKILRSSSKTCKGTFHLQRSLSLPAKGIKSIVDILFDILFDKKFEQTLFRYKFGSDLSQVIFDPKRLIYFESAQEPSISVSVFSQNQATKGVHIPITYYPTFVVPTLLFIFLPFLSL